MKITKTFCLAALLCCAPATVVLSGCGGGNSSLPIGSIPGVYSGTFKDVSGTDANETGTLSVTISTGGAITGSATNSSNESIPFTGTANLSTGVFALTGFFADTNGTAGGTITRSSTSVQGSGTFNLSNGDAGTFIITQTTAF